MAKSHVPDSTQSLFAHSSRDKRTSLLSLGCGRPGLVAMSGSPAHSTYSQISPLSLQDPPDLHFVENNKSPRRSRSSPSLCSRKCPAILHQERPGPNSQDSEPQPVLANDLIRVKIEVSKIVYANMLAGLFAWLLLVSFIVLPATFASIRNSRALDGIGKAGKAVISATQNIPILWVAGSCCVCGASGLLWLWWGQNQNYIWLGDRIFL
jgi:hypothetical protein